MRFKAKHIEPHVKKAAGKLPPEEVTVQNDLGNISFKADVVTPKSLDDLVKIMAKANAENVSAKAVGSLYSFSLVYPRLSSHSYLAEQKPIFIKGQFARQQATLSKPIISREQVPHPQRH
jgi:hypothetical protein